MEDFNKTFYEIIGSKIREIRNNKGLSLEQLGGHIGKSKKTVQRYEMGEHKITIETMKNITDALNYDWKEFQNFMNVEFNKLYQQVDGEIREKQSKYAVHNGYCKIKVYGKICVGNGITVYEDIKDEIICPYPRARGKMIGLQVDGESMNKVIKHGDYAIIKIQPTVENGQVAAIIIGDEDAMLKRFYRLDDETVVLKPESTEDYQPITFFAENINKIKIIGKFIGCVSPCVD